MPTLTKTGSAQGAEWSSTYVDSLPDSSFAFVDGDVRKLPYKNADGKVDLPHVRSALSRLNQTKGIDADDKPKIKTKLQNALKSAKADGLDSSGFRLTQTFGIQADATTQELPQKVMLLRSGEFDPPKYWPFEVTASDLSEMKDNFELGIGLAGDGSKGMPIDYAHEAHKNAAGWIRGLEVEASKDADGNDIATLYGTDIAWSTSGKAAVQGLEYQFLSADFWPRDWPSEWQDSEQAGLTAHNVIRGVALTNVPMFDNNDPISASDTSDKKPAAKAATQDTSDAKGVDFIYVTNQKKEQNSMELDKLRVKAAADLTGPEALFVAQNVDKLSEDERDKFGLKAAASTDDNTNKDDKGVQAANDKTADNKDDKSAQAANDSTGSVSAAAFNELKQQNESMQAAIDALTKQSQASEHDKIKAEVEKHAQRGAIKADQVDTMVKALTDGTPEVKTALRASLSALADNPLLGKTYGSSKTDGSAAADIESEVQKEIDKRVEAAKAANKQYDVFSIRKEVLASNPELRDRTMGAVKAAQSDGFDPFNSSWGTGAKGLTNVNPEVTK